MIFNKIVMVFMLLALLPLGISAKKIKKSNIKVLIVAHNPSKLYIGGYAGSKASSYQAKLARTRGKEFKDLLDKYFKIVDIINSDEYKCVMSEGYDVTIMDDLSKAIEDVDFGMYRNGKSVMSGKRPLIFSRYLDEDYDRATIVIGQITDELSYIYPSKFMTQ